ncbi:FadR/GntR family transcriptional regulator [Robertmurraya sp. DFI.2.37]|uniref:FadR/GntR family transcriptional regulator n=1 Tax=Robertmurraya sp. DFI.2.37 TaxID=3031819 RepID=UPI001244E726|nr:FadR/GntR family transcriptional regulator [Robertmurraya sp. DFI.2.37]MDF1506774.1 FadR/GntR family transcriptional regulator [Robertmurraya sp. DFI.2.37]
MFKTIKKKKKFEEVLEQIKTLLITKKLKVGQKLPNEIELSDSMGISRSSLREALKVLSMIGIVESKSGEGTVVKKADPENLKNIMSLVAISRGLDTFELFEARVILEMAAVRLAAIRRSDEDLNNIQAILEELDKNYISDHEEENSQLDYLFHRSIVLASNNKMLLLLTEVISDLLGEQIRTTRRRYSTSPEILKRFQKEHWGIFYAIKSKNSEEAEQLISSHLEKSRQEFHGLESDL